MISVCMATYNGEKYIKEQIESILPQLDLNDEVIVSDDGSTDDTCSIVRYYAEKDSRIHLVDGPQKGVIANFEYAMLQSQGDIIFLADQDDVWLPEKVQTINHFFLEHTEIDLIISDLVIVDEQLNIIEQSYFDYRKVKLGLVHNIIKNKFIGAGMAFRKEMKQLALPIPKQVPMHDMWLGILANYYKKSALVYQPLTLYRRHSDNVSEIKSQSKFIQQIKWRILLVHALIKKNK